MTCSKKYRVNTDVT